MHPIPSAFSYYIVRLIFKLFFKQKPKNSSYKRTCIKQLPTKCHREIANADLKKIRHNIRHTRKIEEQTCNETHQWAHNCYRYARNHNSDNKRFCILRVKMLKYDFLRELSDKQELKQKSHNTHNRQLVKRN